MAGRSAATCGATETARGSEPIACATPPAGPGPPARNVAERDEAGDRLAVACARGAGREQRRELRREAKPPVDLREIQRLDPEAVAREHEAALPRIPERDAEHAAQPLEA